MSKLMSSSSFKNYHTLCGTPSINIIHFIVNSKIQSLWHNFPLVLHLQKNCQSVFCHIISFSCHIISEFTPLFHSHCFLTLHVSWNTAKSQNSHFLCHSSRLRGHSVKLKLWSYLILAEACEGLPLPPDHLNASGCGHDATFKASPYTPFLLHTRNLPISVFKSYKSLDWGQYVLLAPLGFLLCWPMPLWPSSLDLVGVIQLMYHFLYIRAPFILVALFIKVTSFFKLK